MHQDVLTFFGPTPRTKHRRFLRVEPLEERVVLSTYWVSPSGNDSNSGTNAQPWKTLQACMDKLLPGDTLDIMAGTYAGFVCGWDDTPANVSGISGDGNGGDPYGYIRGTAGNPITIQADPNAAPGSVILNTRNAETAEAIDLEPSCAPGYIIIKGFTFKDPGWNGTTGITDIPNNNGYAIRVDCGNTQILNCVVQNLQWGVAGISCQNGTGDLVQGCTISNINGNGNSSNGHGIYFGDGLSNSQIIGNTISNCDSTAIQCNGDNAVSNNLTVSNNTCYDNGGQLFYINGVTNSLFSNNLVYGTGGGPNNAAATCGIEFDWDTVDDPTLPACTGNVVVNNTIVDIPSAPVRIKSGCVDNTVLNNILLANDGTSLRISSGALTGLVSDYNIGGQATSFYTNEDSGNTSSLTAWRTSSGQDTHSFCPGTSPSTAEALLFVNPSSNNYQELSTSPSMGAGTSTDAPSTDILGNPRPSGNGYDMGCYEYQTGTAPPPPPPPAVTSETPASGATNLAVSTADTATFNEAVQSNTISFTLKNSSGSAVAGSVSYNSTTFVTTFTPSSALAYNTTYTATISGAESTSGVSMTAPFSWFFTTDAPPAHGASPSVTNETPASVATNVAVSTAPTATFNEAVPLGTISFTLKNLSGSSVAGSVSYNSTTYTTTFTPSSALAYNTTYTATISGAQSTSGVPMTAPFSWSFTTDAAPPSVTSETPTSGATGVAVSTKATATFNEAVLASTISFTLASSSGSSVAATVSYNSSNDTATLTPSSALASSTKYTAMVSGARDSAGDPMIAPFSWSFTTGNTASTPITVVSNGSVTYGTTDESSQTVKLPSGTTAGDLAVVTIAWGANSPTTHSSPPAGWSTVAQNVIESSSNGNEGASVYYRVIQAGDTSWTFTMSASAYISFALQSFSGINRSRPIDNTGTTSANSGSNTITANSVTVNNSGAWELIGVSQSNGGTIPKATSFTALSNEDRNSTLLYITTALNSGATGAVTVTGGGPAAGNMLVAIPFTIAPAATAAPTATMAIASATPANESVSLVNTAQVSNQSSSRTLQSGPIQEAVNNGGTVLAPAATGVTSAPSPTLQSNVQSDPHGAVLASLVNDNPIGILPDTFLAHSLAICCK